MTAIASASGGRSAGRERRGAAHTAAHVAAIAPSSTRWLGPDPMFVITPSVTRSDTPANAATGAERIRRLASSAGAIATNSASSPHAPR